MYFHTFQGSCIPQSEIEQISSNYDAWGQVFTSKSNQVDFTQIAIKLLDVDHGEFDDVFSNLTSNSDFFFVVFKLFLLTLKGEAKVPYTIYPQVCRLAKAYKSFNGQIAENDVTNGGTVDLHTYNWRFNDRPFESVKTEKKLGFIYFLSDTANQYVKIGFSTDVLRRVEQHQASNPSLRLLTQIDGTFQEEQYIHDSLAEHSVKGHREWYECKTPQSIVNRATKALDETRTSSVHREQVYSTR